MIGAGYRKAAAREPLAPPEPPERVVLGGQMDPRMFMGMQSSPEATMAPPPVAQPINPGRKGLFGGMFAGMNRPMGGQGLTRGDFLYQLGAYLKDLDPMSGGGNLDRAQAMAQARLREERERQEALRKRQEMHETAIRIGIRPNSPEYVLFMQQPEAWGAATGAWMRPQAGMAGDRPYVFDPRDPSGVRYGTQAPPSRADTRADRALSQKDREIGLREKGVGGYGPMSLYPSVGGVAPIPGHQTPAGAEILEEGGG